MNKNILGEAVFDKVTAEEILEKLALAEGYRDEILHCSDVKVCFSFLDKITEIFSKILEIKESSAVELKKNRLFLQAECAVYSIFNVREDYKKYNSLEKATYRLEFETFPIIEIIIATFTYFNFAALEKSSEEEFWNPETGKAKDLWRNRYIAESIKTGEYKYELSIMVVAFNKWEMTKQCVESLLKWMPADINYELILVNHGSTDGVKTYFESVKPTKQIDIKINSCSIVQCLDKVIEGRYFLSISNDVIMTPNAVENMLRACKEDPKIGFIVPTTPNVSGNQAINIGEYKTADELDVLAAKNNVYNPLKHEERVSLCNPLSFLPTAVYFDPDVYAGGKIYRMDEHKYSFPDDLLSMSVRRKGYKVILQKDAFCHHIGSATLRTETTAQEMNESVKRYVQGAKKYKRYYGIDPWAIGKCFTGSHLIAMLDTIENFGFDGKINVLGINCGLGSDPLKIKDIYKEYKGNTDVHVTNFTNFSRFETDLKTVSERAVYAEDLMALLKAETPESYHHVVMEIPANKEYHTQEFIDQCFDLLTYCGSLFIWCVEDYDEDNECKSNYNAYPFHAIVKK
ncbi:MAG: glycosyltransferase [Ruminococcus sp.]|jgi:GT2 family glycosyltransferase|nr:glycosyltransferase [Ruminococcus sp.]